MPQNSLNPLKTALMAKYSSTALPFLDCIPFIRRFQNQVYPLIPMPIDYTFVCVIDDCDTNGILQTNSTKNLLSSQHPPAAVHYSLEIVNIGNLELYNSDDNNFILNQRKKKSAASLNKNVYNNDASF